MIQSGDDTLHFAVSFTRLTVDAKPLGSFESLYIITKKDRHWGVQARSSFADRPSGS